MRRRTFLAALTFLCWPRVVSAQATPRIAILHSGFPHRTPIDQLYAALRDLGHEHGRTADIQLLGAEGDPARLMSFVRKLTQDRPQVIIAVTSPAALALKRANVSAPVVFLFVSDPIRLGLVESLPRPGGNYTGVTFSDAFLGPKRLELLTDSVPGLRTVAILWSPQFEENAALVESIKDAGKRLGIEIAAIDIGGASRLPAAFDEAVTARAQAVIFLTENALFDHRRTIADLALARGLPMILTYPPEVHDGGLMSFCPDLSESYRRAAALTDRVLKGASPRDLPVEEPSRFTLAINMRTAAALGLNLPGSVLARADEVIE
jgi:putative tryptophan/tyrosine transport system substrate-binding protein